MPAPPFDLELVAALNHPGIALLDPLMSALSNRVVLVSLCVALGLYIYFRSPQKKMGVLVLVLAIAASDATAARVIKPFYQRVRPCNLMPPATRTLASCQHSVSFPSNHAANVAAAAVVAGWATPVLAPYCLAIAFLVGISRVYLGQHWPTDVLAGWALGALLAFLFIQLSRLRYSLQRRPLPMRR